MTHENKGRYKQKHPQDRNVKFEIADALRKRISGEGISCTASHSLALELGESPAEVGFTIDSLEIQITACQLGLFGYPPQKKIVTPEENISPSLGKAIQGRIVNDRLPCKSAWEIAEHMGLKRMAVASACEAMGIKISPCQLGAF